jgi:hypothetical protein
MKRSPFVLDVESRDSTVKGTKEIDAGSMKVSLVGSLPFENTDSDICEGPRLQRVQARGEHVDSSSSSGLPSNLLQSQSTYPDNCI